jgi:hypothetical protein
MRAGASAGFENSLPRRAPEYEAFVATALASHSGLGKYQRILHKLQGARSDLDSDMLCGLRKFEK